MNFYNKHYEFYLNNDNKKFNNKKILKFFYYMIDKYKYNRFMIHLNISRNKNIIYINLNKNASKKEHEHIKYIIDNFIKYLKFYYKNIDIKFYKNKYR